MEHLPELESTFSINLLAHNDFVSPIDETQPFKAFPYQRQLMNIVDFGYDIENCLIDPAEIGIRYPEIITMVCGRQYGKTEGVAATVAGIAVLWKNCHIGIMSNTDDNAKKFIDRIYYYLMNSKYSKEVEGRKVDRIVMKNGVKIYSFGQTPNIRGNSLRLLIIDETAQFEDKMLEGDAMPTTRMAGAYRMYGTPSTILISTPAGDTGKFFDYYLKGVHMRKLVCRGCKTVYAHTDFPNIRKWINPNYPWFLPETPDCPVCGVNNYEWMCTGRIAVIKVDPYKHPYKTPEEIQEELDVAGNTPLARQEILGEIVSESNNIFTRHMLENCVDDGLGNYINVQPNTTYVVAADFGKLHDATVFTVGHRDENQIQILDFIEIIPAVGGLSYEDIRYKLLSLISRYNPVWAVLDANGIGDPIVEQIDRDINDIRIRDVICRYKEQTLKVPRNHLINTRVFSNKKHRKGFVTEMNSKIDLIENAVNCFARKTVRIPREVTPGVKKLWEELLNYGYEYSASKNLKYGTQRGHDDTVISFAMMLWGLRERPWVSFKSAFSGSDSFVL
jgi:hypothetical protein